MLSLFDHQHDNTASLPHPSLAREKLLDTLRLIRSENVGPVTFFQLVSRYGSAGKALKALPMLALRGGAKRSIQVCPVERAEEEIAKTEAFGAQFIPYGSAHYPALLAQIPDPPPVLIARGHPHLLAKPSLLAMVGSRNASANGCRFARKLAGELGETGHVIVSGLARGIDGHAHQGALSSGTVGVIAGGIDHVYPPEHASLYEELATRGVIVTESPFGSAPQHRHFPARNRIIAGMTQGAIVIEATKRSGSLITARCALDYNRDIFAVPGFPLDPRAAGTNGLIQQGAVLVSNAHDISDYLLNRPYSLHDSSTPPGGLFGDSATALEPEETLDSERATIHALLSSTPIAIEELIVMTGIEPRVVNIILLELELAGMLTRHPGGAVSRNFCDE